MGNRRARLIVATAGVTGVLATLPLLPATANGAPVQSRTAPADEGAPGVGDPYYPDYGNGGYDVSHYKLNLKYQPATDLLEGEATLTAKAGRRLTRFNLDFALTVSAVTVNGRPATFATAGTHELVITPARALRKGEHVKVVVRYSGTPSQVQVNGATSWHRTPDGAVAANEPEIAWWWFPSNDHPTDKATYDVSVSVPKGTQAISNGRLAGVKSASGWTRYDWRERQPQASYLATLAVGKFSLVKSRTKSGIPVITAYSKDLTPGALVAAKASVGRTAAVVDWATKLFGPYPFDSAGGYVPNVDVTKVGYALETQTRPFYSPAFFTTGPNLSVVVHENAHQWFGDSVSVKSWRDIWVNEGFARYAEWLWSESKGLGSAQELAEFTYHRYPADDPFWTIKPGDPGSENQFHRAVYNRGAIALQALRNKVGDRAFFRILRTWPQAKKNGNASIEQFIAFAERSSGRRLGDLFKTWLFTAGRPPLPAAKAARLAGGDHVTEPKSWKQLEQTTNTLHQH